MEKKSAERLPQTYLKFTEIKSDYCKLKTKRFAVENIHSRFILGFVRWHGAWRQYCFFPTVGADMVFSAGCLKEISEFLTTANKQHRALREK
jgi:hypothetical protein